MKCLLTIPTRFEWISMLMVLPVTAVWMMYLLFGKNAFSDHTPWLVSYPLVLLLGGVAWYLQVFVTHRVRYYFPCFQKAPFRFVVLLLLHGAILSLAFWALFYGFDRFQFASHVPGTDRLSKALYTAIVCTLIGTTMWEAEYTFRKWKETLAEKEKIEQLSIEQEFETLKGQVNPHFLFNCFNTLSSLIGEDKKKAEVFLDELSKVYRYLLKNNEDGLSSLGTEIKFIRSYYRLLQTRHGEAVELYIDIDPKYEAYLLPSLSLQLLMENAVKHNILSKVRPLVIHIFTAGSQLVVNNNLQLRSVQPPSNKIGLQNIQTKYALLKQPGFQVIKDNRSFTVALPLIKNKQAAAHLQHSNLQYESPYR